MRIWNLRRVESTFAEMFNINNLHIMHSFKKQLFLSLMTVGLISVSSCTSTETDKKIVLDLNDGQTVKVDSVPVECLLSVWSMEIVDDTLILANNKNETLFETFELPSLRHIASGGINGQGPGELTNPLLHTMRPYFGHCFALSSQIGTSFDIVDVESLTKVDTRTHSLPQNWHFLSDYIFMPNDLLAGENGESPHVWAIVDNNGEIVTEFPQNIPDDVKAMAVDDFTKMVMDTSWGVASDKKRAIAIGYKVFPLVELYNYDGEFISSIESEYTLGEKFDLWLKNMKATDDYLYLNFKNNSPDATSAYTIVKTDWQGNIKAMYALPKPVLNFAVDEKNNKIYFNTKSSSDVDYIHYFDM